MGGRKDHHPMRSIALYNRQGQRLLTLREAQDKGYGLTGTLRKRIHSGTLRAYKAGWASVVLEKDLVRPKRRRGPARGRRR
ncbi:MAG: hypothetical protein Q8R28_12700 [Dehalococcoidia bacterium]|nr:hypothetical protein [Dehalococcoidia bacterium]